MKHDAVVARVMKEHDVVTKDRYTLMLGFAGRFPAQADNVHHPRDGGDRIASEAAATLENKLPQREK